MTNNFAVTLLLTMSIAFLAPQRAVAVEKELSFVFNWPVGMQVTVDESSDKGKSSKSEEGEKSHFRFVVENAGSGKRAIIYSYSLPGTSKASDDDEEPDLAPAVTLIIDAQGNFERVGNIDELAGEVDRSLAATTRSISKPENTAQVRKLLASQRFLAALYQNDWNAIVGSFAGRSFVPGKEYAVEGMAQLPVPGNPEVKVKTRVVVEGPLPCNATGTKVCARIITETRFDRAGAEKGLRAFMEGAGVSAKIAKFSLKDVDLATTSTLLTEIATMKPYERLVEKRVSFTITDAEGNELPSLQRERRKIVYTCLPLSAK